MSGSSISYTNTTKFDRPRHVKYFASCLRKLPSDYDKLDTNRLTLVHFCVQALDLLGVWDDERMAREELKLDKKTIIEWIYALQTTTTISSSNEGVATAATIDPAFCGFKGGTFLGVPPPEQYNHGHIAMTYTALATLRTLGDDLSRVDRPGIVAALTALQRPDNGTAAGGSFQAIAVGSEYDMRFLYCACCISHMLNDWTGVDTERALAYIRQCRSYDGGFALVPGQEGHGGSTFCAVASLVLMQRLDDVLPNTSNSNNCNNNNWRSDLIRWCTHRQVSGMQGRPNKDEDTCYSYWIGGTLRLLGEDALLDHCKLRAYVMKCQTKMGGFSKIIGSYPDVLHSFYSMAYLSLSQVHFEDNDNTTKGDPNDVALKAFNCTLGICNEKAELFRPVFP